MEAKRSHGEGGAETFALAFGSGEEVVSGLTEFAEEAGIDAASFTALGAFSGATLGFFDMQRKEYQRIPVDEQAEVLSLIGTVALFDGRPKLHPHAVLGLSDGTTRGGHLLEGNVRPVLEVTLAESPAHLRRRTDPETGLPLLVPEE